jgi:hypothetical protein
MPVIFMYAEVFLADALCFCMSPGRYPISIPCHTLQIAPLISVFSLSPRMPAHPLSQHHLYPMVFAPDQQSSPLRVLGTRVFVLGSSHLMGHLLSHSHPPSPHHFYPLLLSSVPTHLPVIFPLPNSSHHRYPFIIALVCYSSLPRAQIVLGALVCIAWVP